MVAFRFGRTINTTIPAEISFSISSPGLTNDNDNNYNNRSASGSHNNNSSSSNSNSNSLPHKSSYCRSRHFRIIDKNPSASGTKMPPSSPLRRTSAGAVTATTTTSDPASSSNGGGATKLITKSAPTTPNRARVNSRDIPRSYSGLYGEENDLLPFELNRKQHTDWLESKLLLATYLAGILVFEIIVMAILDSGSSMMNEQQNNEQVIYWSWTVTNAVHCLLSMIYLHWLKGSIFDNQGEMAALTLWEQLEGRRKTQTVKRVLTAVPTILCYAACHFAGYEFKACLLNGILWFIHVLGKLPVMNGRRIFGINRTTGIDDDAVPDKSL